MFLPILGLMGIVLYGTTRASRPPSLEDGVEQVEAVLPRTVEAAPTAPRPRAEPPAPPPAPRLDSAVEEEAQRRAEVEQEGRSQQVATDSTVLAPEDASRYVPAPIIPGQ